MAEAFPLHWPQQHRRTPEWQRRRSKFDTSIAGAVEFVLAEIRRMKGTLPVISTDLQLRNDGLPYANQRQPSDQGAAVYFLLKGKQQAFACDRWDRIQDNLHAIGKTIEALRGIERWGSGSMVEAAFAGFTALPAPSELKPEDWQLWLGTHCGALPADIAALNQLYRDAARKFAADEIMLRNLNIARDAARKDLRS